MPLPLELERWADEGTLVPILGEACLRIGLEPVEGPLPDPLKSIVDRMARSVRDFDPSSAERGFVEFVVEQVPLAISREVLVEQEGRVLPDYEDDVVALCRQLTRASTMASCLFAEGLRIKSAVFGYAEHTIEVGADVEKLQERIDKAVEAAATLQERAQASERAWARAKVERGEAEWDHPDRALFERLGPAQIRARLEALRESLADPKLVGSMVEFLTAMLWHCYRFDSDVPPTSGELALQISLTAHRQPGVQTWLRPRRTHLNWLRTVDKAEVARYVATALQSTDANPGRTAHPARNAFYREIAHFLLGPGGSVDAPDREALRRIAFVTTFDLEVEQALFRSLGRYESFHVVIPVVLQQERAGYDQMLGKSFRPTWLVGTFKAGNGGQAVATRWSWGVTGVGKKNSLKIPVQLTGPIVVKLCGSPLHQTVDPGTPGRIMALDGSKVSDHPLLVGPLGEAEEASPLGDLLVQEGDLLFHDIALAELDHLERAPAFSDRMPLWIQVAVGLPSSRLTWRKRQIMFVGLPVIDWIDRLWVFFQKKGFDSKPGQSNRHKFLAVDDEFEPTSAETLDTFGIRRWDARFEQVTAVLAASRVSQARAGRTP